ncbi:MAG: DUF2127 domain-containing protein [Candidatus Magasanikbacteria bacterium]|nr:DUF2127 domain-containing protein [Candidatus Magasanikbacteria bacterium]
MKKINSVIHYLFLAAVVAKAFNGIVEIIGSFLILSYDKLVQLEALALTNYELTEHHNDFIAKFFIDSAHNLSINTRHFISFYLFFHGAMNFFLVISIYKKKMWAYPLAIFLFSIFLAYQVFRVYHNHSVGLAVVSVVDVFMIILTWLEYRRISAKM